ncbi:hypothetical protein [Polyangium jinanense]|uniref:Collagen-like protein n=1 Tax=Polyangium jinanense TaxID=2829994 RepID=A0A9X3WW60_9BACT|nr:hypothetical protein [Polyangium jinanense]MDC3953475.1 hypothetical protein [Polyangium jinanense]MDC3979404.1 hypothetical protein [Polyangium jinanense]
MSFLRHIASLPFVAALPLLVGCGPSQAQIDPKNVVNVSVRPASGQMLFCPGDAFQVELVAKLKDGSSCSNVDPNKGCMGQKDTVISSEMVRIQGSSGAVGGGNFIWMPDRDVLKTADTGMGLRGWLESATSGKSMEGEAQLKPVYDCQMEQKIRGGKGREGEPGAPGPELTVAITTLSTPFFPDAALVRIDWPGNRFYMISPSADKPVRITSIGGEGGHGREGAPGIQGKDGKDATEDCAEGTNGTDGTEGGPGGRGGDGGPGGLIKVILDDANPDKLKGRLLLESVGGPGGDRGPGGKGGFGGKGGKGGPLKAGDATCKPKDGKNGQLGRRGPSGDAGRQGPSGPAPVFEMGQRKVMFANEISSIQRIEAGKGK